MMSRAFIGADATSRRLPSVVTHGGSPGVSLSSSALAFSSIEKSAGRFDKRQTSEGSQNTFTWRFA